MPAWRGAAFGLELRGDFPAPGFSSAGVAGADGQVQLRIGEVEERGGSTALVVQPLPQGRFTIAREQDGTYLLVQPYYGRFRVSADGREIVCAPSDLAPWHWQRFVVGQLLPLAATLQGIEPLHAGVVELDGRAVLVMGTSGAGKSSSTLHLAARGATFMADDIGALEMVDGEVQVHPGPGIASVDPDELERMPVTEWERLGVADGELRVLLPAGSAAVPLGAVYVLARREDGELSVTAPRASLATVLLGGTFNAYIDDRERLARQFDLAASAAGSVPVRELTVPPAAGAADVAEFIRADFG